MKTKSVRNIVLSYVQNQGPSSWNELQKVVCIAAGQPLGNVHYGSSYLDRVSEGTSAMLPTKTDSRYLVKSHVDGLYHLVNE